MAAGSQFSRSQRSAIWRFRILLHGSRREFPKKREGIRLPRLYELGFAHNNCGGFCVKAGQGHFANLLRAMPARYAKHEALERAMRAYLGKDVSVLTDRRGDGKKKPLTLRDLRMRIESGAQVDAFDIGGCGCFVEELA